MYLNWSKQKTKGKSNVTTNCQKRLAIYAKSHSILWLLFQAHNSLFKFGRQRSTMNIMSTLGEEVDKGGDGFNEEEEDTEESSSVITTSSGENKVIVRMRDKKCLSRPQSDETSRVRQQLISAFLMSYPEYPVMPISVFSFTPFRFRWHLYIVLSIARWWSCQCPCRSPVSAAR